MATAGKLVNTSTLILVALGVSAIALAVLFTFPEEPAIWEAASWTFVAGLSALLVLVAVAGYVLTTNRAARTWQRFATFLIGLACLAAAAVGSL